MNNAETTNQQLMTMRKTHNVVILPILIFGGEVRCVIGFN